MARAFTEQNRFVALRACWTILRGGSVGYKLNFEGDVTSLSGPALFTLCQVNGEDLQPWHLEHLHGSPQPDAPAG